MHEPLAFLGAAFKGAERNWSTFEKEAFSIYQAFKKMDYLFYSDKPAHVFTDHRNLLFVFAPLALEPALGRHVVNKVQRWALFLSQFPYVIEHVDGSRNVFADILTRWLKGYRAERKKARTMCKLVMNRDIVESPTSGSFIWPTISSFQDCQTRFPPSPEMDKVLWCPEDCLWRRENCIWIPRKAHELQMKVLVVSHCSLGGHRGVKATESIIRENFYWDDMHDDVKAFVKACIHCIITRSGEVIPRPLGSQIHGTRPNEVVHMDYLYMGKGFDGLQYVLLIRDDLSSFVWTCACRAANGEFAAEVLAKWVANFGTMTWLVSDQGSHFHNTVHTDLVHKFKTKRHFTVAYSPWANGTVERVNREVLRATKALLSEWKLAPQDWPAVIDCVQSVLNQSPLPRLGLRSSCVHRSPLQVFTGIPPSRPLLCALPTSKYKTAHFLDEVRAAQILEVETLQEALDGMHKEVAERVSQARAKAILKHNMETNVLPANFHEGDFVLVRKAQISKGHKLQFLWMGPKRVVRTVSKWVFEVEGLIDQKRELVHARRLLWYRADRENKELSSDLLAHVSHSEASYQTVEALLDIRKVEDVLEVLVEWQGLPDQVDRTWELVATLHEDIPEQLENFLPSHGKKKLKDEARELLEMSKQTESS